MKLFYSTGTCSLASHILLLELGLKFSVEKVDIRNKHYSGGDYKQVNPKGSVPAIELENGEILTEGAVILQYIADQKPESGLMPKPGTMERYRAQEWLNFVGSDIHKTFGVLFAADRWVTNKEGNEQLKNSAREALSGRFTVLASKLGDNKFLMGDKFTAPDTYLFTVLRWAPMMGIELERWPSLKAYQQRIHDRPSVKQAMETEGLKI